VQTIMLWTVSVFSRTTSFNPSGRNPSSSIAADPSASSRAL